MLLISSLKTNISYAILKSFKKGVLAKKNNEGGNKVGTLEHQKTI